MAPLRAWDTDRLGRLRLHRRVQLGHQCAGLWRQLPQVDGRGTALARGGGLGHRPGAGRERGHESHTGLWRFLLTGDLLDALKLYHNGTTLLSSGGGKRPCLPCAHRAESNQKRRGSRKAAGFVAAVRGARTLGCLLALQSHTRTILTLQKWAVIALPPHSSLGRGAVTTTSTHRPPALLHRDAPRVLDAGPASCDSQRRVEGCPDAGPGHQEWGHARHRKPRGREKHTGAMQACWTADEARRFLTIVQNSGASLRRPGSVSFHSRVCAIPVPRSSYKPVCRAHRARPPRAYPCGDDAGDSMLTPSRRCSPMLRPSSRP